MSHNKFSDRQLAELYEGLHKHYQDRKIQGISDEQLYEELAVSIERNLQNQGIGSPLYHLDESEKHKARAVLRCMMQIRTDDFKIPPKPEKVIPEQITINFYETNPIYHRTYCDHRSNLLWDLAAINMISGGHHHHHYPSGGDVSGSSSNHKTDCGQALAAALILLLLFSLIIMATIAVYFILNEVLDAVERFYYQEGCLQAFISLATLAVTTVLSAALSSLLLTGPLSSLAIAAGFANPVVPVIAAVVCMAIIGGMGTKYLLGLGQEHLIKRSNPKALDPQDPHRFALTDEQATKLISKSIDPVKVKCAIFELRLQMNKEKMPYFLNRMFSNHSVQSNLELIRKLKSGEKSEIELMGKHFSCKMDAYSEDYCHQESKNYGTYRAVLGSNAGIYEKGYEPSAPEPNSSYPPPPEVGYPPPQGYPVRQTVHHHHGHPNAVNPDNWSNDRSYGYSY